MSNSEQPVREESARPVGVALPKLIRDLGESIKRIDSRRPQAANMRTGEKYQPGIGPHPETQAVDLMAAELLAVDPGAYESRVHLDVPYPGSSRQKCDLCLGIAPKWEWCIEVKMLRLMGDNGKPNDNMLMHILSPYAKDRSALTDCTKLLESGFAGRKAVVIYGFDYPGVPMDPAIEAFELLARSIRKLSARAEATYAELVHPVHVAGRVFGWEVVG